MSDNPKDSEPIVFRDAEEREAWDRAFFELGRMYATLIAARSEQKMSVADASDAYLRARRKREPEGGFPLSVHHSIADDVIDEMKKAGLFP